MANEQITGLVDIALQFKQHIENRDVESLYKLFDPNAKINIYGRFYTLKALIANLQKLFGGIEQPGVDIMSVDESEIKAETAFAAFNAEIYWIDQKSWEEVSQVVTMSLELKRHAEQKSPWVITGLTLARNKKIIEEKDVPIFPGRDDPKESSDSFVDNLLSFWY